MLERNQFQRVIGSVLVAVLFLTLILPVAQVKADTEPVFISVAAGAYHTLGLKSDGTVMAWGQNNSGQLGDGTKVNRSSPIQVSGLTDVKQISGGSTFSLAVKNDGTLWYWGAATTQNNSLVPVKIDAMDNVKEALIGYQSALALTNDGDVWAWGTNSHGQIGNGSTSTWVHNPVNVLSGAVGIAAGVYHSLALMADGTVMSWGRGNEYQLGNGEKSDVHNPTSVPGLNDVTKIQSGFYHNIAYKNDGTVWVWGANSDGLLGLGDNYTKTEIIQLEGFTDEDAFIMGNYHTNAIRTDGLILSWGRNLQGQLGDRSSTSRFSPVAVKNSDNSNFTGAVTGSGGQEHSVMIKDGQIVAWGGNQYGQLGNGTTTARNYAMDIIIPDAPGFNNSPQAAPGALVGTTRLSGIAPDAGHRLVARVSSTVVPTPKAGSAAPTGVSVIDPYEAGNEIAGVDKDANRYVALYEVNASGQVVRFQLVSLTEGDIRSLEPPSGTAYITSFDSGVIDVVDLSTLEVELAKYRIQEIPGGISATPQPNSAGFNPNGEQVFVTVRNERRVIVIDTTNSNPPVSVPVGSSPYGVAFSPDGSLAYIANQGDDTLSVVHTARLNDPVGVINLEQGCKPVNLASAVNKLYVTCSALNKIVWFPLELPHLKQSIDLPDGSPPNGISVSVDESKLYAALQNTGEVAVIDTNTDAVEALIPIPREGNFAYTIATEVSPDGSEVYAVNWQEGAISIINTATNTVIDTIKLTGAKLPYVVGVSSDGNWLYTVNYGDSTMSVIDLATRNVADTISVSQGPYMVGTFMMPVAIAHNADSMPPAPPVLQDFLAGEDEISFSWTQVAGVDQYKLYISDTPDAFGTAQATVSESQLGKIGNTVHASLQDGVYTVAISGLSPASTYYVAVTSVNDNGEGLKINTINVATSLPAPVPAPAFEPVPRVEPGVQPGTTSLKGIAAAAGNQLIVRVSSGSTSRPNEGEDAPSGEVVINPYEAGHDIPGVNATANRYVALYEIDVNQNIIRFSEVMLTENDIKSAPVPTPAPAPAFDPVPRVESGDQPGTTSLKGIAAAAGNQLIVRVSSGSTSRPNEGEDAPSGSDVINPYEAGSDIPGVNATTNRYVALYEIDAKQHIVRFSEVLLITNDINPVQTGGSGGSTGTVTSEIFVDVVAGEGEIVTRTPIRHTIHSDGTVTDRVALTTDRAEEAADQLMDKPNKTMRIIIPDAEDRVSETIVSVPAASLKILSDNNVDIEIETAGALAIIPGTSIVDFDKELYFRFVPVKKEQERRDIEERAKREEMVRQISSSLNVNVLGRPMTIETNLQSRPVVLMMPLQEKLPEDEKEKQELLDNLVVFIEHSDGTKELVRGEWILDDRGRESVRFSVNKFSTFTMLYLEGSLAYFNELEEQNQTGTHDPYIYGIGDGLFAPDRMVTRAQMASMMIRNLRLGYSGGDAASFVDIDAQHWAFEEIELAHQLGLMIGYADGRFGANDGITRAQMAVIADRWVQRKRGTSTPSAGAQAAVDVPRGHWAYEAIVRMQGLGVMIGFDDHSFRPDDLLTRAQAVRVMNFLAERGTLLGIEQPTFRDVPVAHWAFTDIEVAARGHRWKLDVNGNETVQ